MHLVDAGTKLYRLLSVDCPKVYYTTSESSTMSSVHLWLKADSTQDVVIMCSSSSIIENVTQLNCLADLFQTYSLCDGIECSIPDTVCLFKT